MNNEEVSTLKDFIQNLSKKGCALEQDVCVEILAEINRLCKGE